MTPALRMPRWWCRILHGRPMYPFRGQYRCRRCWRVWPVPWEADGAALRRIGWRELRRGWWRWALGIVAAYLIVCALFKIPD